MKRHSGDHSNRSVVLCEKRTAYRLCLAQCEPVSNAIATSSRPYERRLLSVSSRFLSAGDRVIDVGANLGNHALYWCRVAGAVVDAFEPNPASYELLNRNVEINDAPATLRVHHLALGSHEGRGSVIADPGNPAEARVTRTDGGEVEIRRLDSLIGPDDRIRLIKVDVEGAELEVLRGAGDILRERPVLLVELHSARERRAMRQFLRPVGYVRVPVNLAGAPTYLHVASLPDRLRVVLLMTSWSFWVCLTGPVHHPIRRWLRAVRSRRRYRTDAALMQRLRRGRDSG